MFYCYNNIRTLNIYNSEYSNIACYFVCLAKFLTDNLSWLLTNNEIIQKTQKNVYSANKDFKMMYTYIRFKQ